MENGHPGVKVAGRGCTDIICCLLFVVCICFMIGVSGFAIVDGDLKKIATKYDMDGNLCTGEHPNKLFTRLMPVRRYKNALGLPKTVSGGRVDTAYYAVCIDKCPKKDDKNLKFLPNK